MAIPKTKKPITERKTRLDIEKAMKSASMMETPGVTPEEGSAKNSRHSRPENTEEKMNITDHPKIEEQVSVSPSSDSSAVQKKTTEKPMKRLETTRTIGRPPLVEGRSERMTVWMRPEIKKRLKRALLKEKLLREEHDKDIDQSLLVEEAIIKWMEARKY